MQASPDSAAGSRPRVHPARVGRLRLSCVGHWRNSSLKRQSTWSLLGIITPTRELARFTRQSRCPGHLPPSLRRQPDMNIFAQGDCKQAGTAPVYFVVGMAGFIPSPIVLPARKEFSFVDRSRPMSFCLCSAQTSTAVAQLAVPFPQHASRLCSDRSQPHVPIRRLHSQCASRGTSRFHPD